MATPKQVARSSRFLPEDCSLEDIAYHFYVRGQVEEGICDVDEGRAVPHAQVMREAADSFLDDSSGARSAADERAMARGPARC